MDLSNLKYKGKILFHKYKYAVVVIILGIGLMLIPANSKKKQTNSDEIISVKPTQSVQQELQEILSCVQGVGEVKIYLKEASGQQTIYETNHISSVSDNTSDIKKEVITITDADRNESGLIKQINPPCYQGAIVICHGAKDPEIKLAITDAVSKVTGLGTDKIAVLIMK